MSKEMRAFGIFLKFMAGLTIVSGLGIAGISGIITEYFNIGYAGQTMIILASASVITSGIIVFITSKFEVDN